MNEKIDIAVVLAGGPATRLRPLTNSVPKGMIEVCGKPLLEWIVEWLKSNGVRNIVFGVAYLKDKIIDYFGDGTSFGLNIKYSVHTVEGGTCQGFRLAIERYITQQDFFALNGDQITDLDLSELATLHMTEKPTATIAINNPRCPYGHVKMNDRYEVTNFVEKPSCHILCNTGNYVFNRKILNYLPAKGDIERLTFPILAREHNLRGYYYNGFFVTVNTYRDLIEAEEALRKRGKQK